VTDQLMLFSTCQLGWYQQSVGPAKPLTSTEQPFRAGYRN
jgi:hypothetical protein